MDDIDFELKHNTGQKNDGSNQNVNKLVASLNGQTFTQNLKVVNYIICCPTCHTMIHLECANYNLFTNQWQQQKDNIFLLELQNKDKQSLSNIAVVFSIQCSFCKYQQSNNDSEMMNCLICNQAVRYSCQVIFKPVSNISYKEFKQSSMKAKSKKDKGNSLTDRCSFCDTLNIREFLIPCNLSECKQMVHYLCALKQQLDVIEHSPQKSFPISPVRHINLNNQVYCQDHRDSYLEKHNEQSILFQQDYHDCKLEDLLKIAITSSELPNFSFLNQKMKLAIFANQIYKQLFSTAQCLGPDMFTLINFENNSFSSIKNAFKQLKFQGLINFKIKQLNGELKYLYKRTLETCRGIQDEQLLYTQDQSEETFNMVPEDLIDREGKSSFEAWYRNCKRQLTIQESIANISSKQTEGFVEIEEPVFCINDDIKRYIKLWKTLDVLNELFAWIQNKTKKIFTRVLIDAVSNLRNSGHNLSLTCKLITKITKQVEKNREPKSKLQKLADSQKLLNSFDQLVQELSQRVIQESTMFQIDQEMQQNEENPFDDEQNSNQPIRKRSSAFELFRCTFGYRQSQLSPSHLDSQFQDI
eukprot:403341046